MQSSGCASNDPGTRIDLTQSSWLPHPHVYFHRWAVKNMDGPNPVQNELSRRLSFQNILSGIISPLLEKKRSDTKSFESEKKKCKFK